MEFIGKKAASGATRKYCSRDGYGNKIQVIYNRKTDRVSWYQSVEEIVNRLENRIAEIDAIEKYINANVNF